MEQQSFIKSQMPAPVSVAVADGGYTLSPEDIAYFQSQRTKRIRGIVAKCFVYLVLVIWAFLAIFPIVWVFYNSFKSKELVQNDPIGFNFGQWSLANYAKATDPVRSQIDVWLAYWNSIYTSVLCVFICLTVAVLMAFALSRYKFRGSRVLEALVIACMMFPAFSLATPLYNMYDNLGLIDTHLAYILPQVALNMSFTTTLLIGFFRSLPIEVEESAFLDGASVGRTLLQIVLPMMRSALITCVIFIFLWTYNDLFIQNLVCQDARKRMLPYLLLYINSRGEIPDYGMFCAVGTMIALPMLLIYFLLQKHIIKGLTAGAVKG